MDIRTHQKIDTSLCGTPRVVDKDHAEIELRCDSRMGVDEHGLVHGGFLFGLASHAAMLAVNEPTVVLADASTKFLWPVVVGDVVVARAYVEGVKGKRHQVRIDIVLPGAADNGGDVVCVEAVFQCAVPATHVVERVRKKA